VAAVDRGIPFGRAGLDEAPQCFGQRRAQQSALQLQVAGGILQLQKHRMCAQQGVHRSPRLRLGAQQPILEGPRSQRGQTRVRAPGIGVEQRPARIIQTRHRSLGHVAKLMPPQVAVGGEERRAEECGELAGRGAAQQIHLKEPILGMQIAERERQVASILRRDGRHSEGIAAHAHLGMHAGPRRAAVEPWKARAQCQPSGERRDHHDAGEGAGRRGAEAPGAGARCSAHVSHARASVRAAFPHGTP
jgi:hypothetical protein